MVLSLAQKREILADAAKYDVSCGLALTRARIEEATDDRAAAKRKGATAAQFAPAGQSTPMIVGADGADDVAILGASASLYASYRLKRVYYSAFSPTQHPSAQLAQVATPLIREHRLYQADWLLRFYGFTLGDLRAAAPTGTLDPNVDPKLAWALLHRETFPLDINSAAREPSLRVPGFGTRSVDRILASRRTGRLRLEDLARLGCALVRARPSSSLPIIILATCLTMRGCGRSLRRNHLNSYCSTSPHVRCGNCARCRRGRVPRCRPAMPRRECGARHDSFR